MEQTEDDIHDLPDQIKNMFFRPSSQVDEDSGDEDENQDFDADEDINKAIAKYTEGGPLIQGPVPGQRRKGNTGPKGVLGDYHDAKRNKELQMLQEKEIRDQKIRAQCVRLPVEMAKNSEEDDNEDDDDFMKQYRQQRIRELQALATRPRYGFLSELDVDSFLPTIEIEGHVVVHLYKPEIILCKQVNEILSNLSKKYPHTCFGKMLSEQSLMEFDDMLLPIVLVYKQGELIQKYIPLLKFIARHELNIESFEKLFSRNGILAN